MAQTAPQFRAAPGIAGTICPRCKRQIKETTLVVPAVDAYGVQTWAHETCHALTDTAPAKP